MTVSASSKDHHVEEDEQGSNPAPLDTPLRRCGEDVTTLTRPVSENTLELMESDDVTDRQDAESGAGAEVPLLEDHEVKDGQSEADPDVTQEAEEEVTQAAEEEEDDGVPYDRGWSWVLVSAIFINNGLMAGYLKSSGIIFVELLGKFNASTTHTAIFFSVRAAVLSVTGLYVLNVCLGKFGSRPIMLFGASCVSLSAILAAFANDLSLFIVINSTLLGMGMSMMTAPGEVLISKYFKKRRSLALALGKCGASVFNIAIPPLITWLLGEYGLSGTLLLFGGLCLHAIPAAMLFRPTAFYSEPHRRRRDRQRQMELEAKKKLKEEEGEVMSGVGGGGGGGSGGTDKHPGVVAEDCGGDSQSSLCPVAVARSAEKGFAVVEMCGGDGRTDKPNCVAAIGGGGDDKELDSQPSCGAAAAGKGVVVAVCGDDSTTSENAAEVVGFRKGVSRDKVLQQKAGEKPSSAAVSRVWREKDKTGIPLRQRTYSEPPDKPLFPPPADIHTTNSNNHSDANKTTTASAVARRGRPGGVLEALSQSGAVHYVSMTSLDMTSLSMASLDLNATSAASLSRLSAAATAVTATTRGDDDRGRGRGKGRGNARKRDNDRTIGTARDNERGEDGGKGRSGGRDRGRDSDNNAVHDRDSDNNAVHNRDSAFVGESVDSGLGGEARRGRGRGREEGEVCEGTGGGRGGGGGGEEENASSKSSSCVMTVVQCPRRVFSVLDWSLFRRPVFRLVMLYMLTLPLATTGPDYLPAFARERGLTESETALLLSIMGGLDLVCRVLSGLMADLKFVRVPVMAGVSLLVLAIVTQFVRFMTTFTHFAVWAGLQGLIGGVAICLWPVLLIEFVGLRDMGKAMGFCQLVGGASKTVYYPALGYIRDVTGSYSMVYHIVGCGMLAAAFLLFCEGPVRRLEERRARRQSVATA